MSMLVYKSGFEISSISTKVYGYVFFSSPSIDLLITNYVQSISFILGDSTLNDIVFTLLSQQGGPHNHTIGSLVVFLKHAQSSKLSPRGDGPFKVLKKIGDNAYVLELPGDYQVSATFNVQDLTLFEGEEEEELDDSRSNLFQEGEDDEGSSGQQLIPPVPEFEGALTRSRAKEVQQELDKLVAFFSSKELDTNEEPPLKTVLMIEVRERAEDGGDEPRPRLETASAAKSPTAPAAP